MVKSLTGGRRAFWAIPGRPADADGLAPDGEVCGVWVRTMTGCEDREELPMDFAWR
jgi:hypothetical protein